MGSELSRSNIVATHRPPRRTIEPASERRQRFAHALRYRMGRIRLVALSFKPLHRKRARHGQIWWRRLSSVAALSLVVVLVAACADDDSERRFANDPIPTEDIAAQPTQPPAENDPTQTAIAVTPIALEQILAATGAAGHFFVQAGNVLLSVPLDGAAPTEIFKVERSSIVTYAGSPNGDRLAVVTAGIDGGLTMHLINAAGEQIASAPLADVQNGSPVPSPGTGVARIAWAPSGDRVLVTLPAGGIVEVNDAGQVREILQAENAPSPQAVAWSPSGGAIAYVDAGIDGTATGLYVASTDVLPVDPVAVIRPIEGRSRQIAEIAWSAGNAGILYAERSPSGDLSVGGDLFAVSPTGGTPKLVASAGRVTQVGAVGAFSVAPDGSAVAYTVIVPGQGGPTVSTLKVKQIAGPTAADLPLQFGGTLQALGWAAGGLTWAELAPASGQDFGLVVQRARPDGTVETIYSGLPPASPVASPVPPGSPVPAE